MSNPLAKARLSILLHQRRAQVAAALHVAGNPGVREKGGSGSSGTAPARPVCEDGTHGDNSAVWEILPQSPLCPRQLDTHTPGLAPVKP